MNRSERRRLARQLGIPEAWIVGIRPDGLVETCIGGHCTHGEH